jgi:hypothetical protein
MKVEHTKRWAMALVGTLVLQQVGCAAPQEGADGPNELATLAQALTKGSTAEALFQEILFPNAKAAARVPTLQRLYEYTGLTREDSEQRKALDTVQSLLVEGIRELDPGFFERFEASVTSGDVLKVDAALSEATGLLQRALRQWDASLSGALSEERLSAISKRFASDPKLQDLAQQTLKDPAAARKLGDLLLSGIDRGPAGDVIIQVDIDNIKSVVLPNPPALDADYQSGVDNLFSPVADVTVEVDVAIYVEVAVAVAVAAVAVLVFERPGDFSAQYLNGKNNELFRDQLVAGITQGYAVKNLRAGANFNRVGSMTRGLGQ